MTKLDELYKKAAYIKTVLEQTEAEIAFEQSNLRAEVSFEKKGDTYILTHKDRTIKVKATGPYHRYKIWEGRKILAKESLDNLSRIRLNFALGKI